MAKQAANANRRGCGGFRGPRDISSDSGFSSIGKYNSSATESITPPTHQQQRRIGKPRNLEMVSNGRHKFDVRELTGDDSLSDSEPLLSLPQLPSAFTTSNQQTAPLSGLIRTVDYATASASAAADTSAAKMARRFYDRSTDRRNSTEEEEGGGGSSFRKTSLTSLDVDGESVEEEKMYRDNSTSEKGAGRQTSAISTTHFKEYSPSSKNSSPVSSSRASWCNAGESMAIKDCSSMSVSSCDSNREKELQLSVDLTMTAPPSTNADELDHSSSPYVTINNGKQSFADDNTNDSVVRNCSALLMSERALTIDIGNKFAQITASVDDLFLDDETSPTDSLISSTESDDQMAAATHKKNKKRINDSINKNIQNIDEISPMMMELVSSPLSPGTPTHASNSLSLSDEGRDDFLIDDEIADQPALCFADNHGNS